MEKKSDVSSPDLSEEFGIKFEDGYMNFNSYHLDLSFRQLRIIQLSLMYFDSLNRGSMSQTHLDDLFFTLRQVDRLISEDVK